MDLVSPGTKVQLEEKDICQPLQHISLLIPSVFQPPKGLCKSRYKTRVLSRGPLSILGRIIIFPGGASCTVYEMWQHPSRVPNGTLSLSRDHRNEPITPASL